MWPVDAPGRKQPGTVLEAIRLVQLVKLFEAPHCGSCFGDQNGEK